MGDEPIGERVAVLKTRVDTIAGEVDSLRKTRHEHGSALQRHELQIDDNSKAVEAMTAKVVPAIYEQLEKQAKDIRALRESGVKQKTDFGWVMKILLFVLMTVSAIAQGALMIRVEQALNRPAVAAPRKP